MRKCARRLLIAGAIVAVAGALSVAGVYRASRQVPEFYSRALARPNSLPDEGQRFEQHALDLHNQSQHVGPWEVRFTPDEINAWLAIDLPEKFPQALPPGVSDPRVAIDGSVVRVAVHYQRGGVDTVISLAGDAYLTDQPNEIAVRVAQARAGLVPVPLARFLHEITERAARANIPLRWTEVKGAPVALLRLSLDRDESPLRHMKLERLHFADGQFVVGGRTDELPPVGDASESSTAAQSNESETRQR